MAKGIRILGDQDLEIRISGDWEKQKVLPNTPISQYPNPNTPIPRYPEELRCINAIAQYAVGLIARFPVEGG